MPHPHHGKDVHAVRLAVLTVSDSRSREDDHSGRLILDQATAAGHEVAAYRIVADEPVQIRWALHVSSLYADAVILNGGTGIAPRDVTYEVVTAMFEREVPGFGELFRSLSYAEIGAAAMLSRASCGIYRCRVVFALPGSTKAVGLAMEKLILPQLGHMVGLLRTGR